MLGPTFANSLMKYGCQYIMVSNLGINSIHKHFNILNCESEPCSCTEARKEPNGPGNHDSQPEVVPTLVAESPVVHAQAIIAPSSILAPKEAKSKNGDYKKRMLDRSTKLKALEAALDERPFFDQAVFFVESEAPFVEYKKLIRAVDKDTQGFQGKDNPAAQLVALATAQLLDKALEKAERSEMAFSSEDLTSLLVPLREKGLNPALLSKTWDSRALKAIFNEEKIEQFAQLLKLK